MRNLGGYLPRSGRRWFGRAVVLLVVGWAMPPFALADESVPAGANTVGDFGGNGLLQVPTARFLPDGEIAFSSGRVAPFFRNALTLQPLPWLEGVLRYTTIQNRDYGAAGFSGNQKYKDRGVDLKIRLLEESAQAPQIALGLRDVGGTGLFSSEYLVASRRYFDWDFSFGIAWGNLGSRGQIPNPLATISSRFKRRQNDFGEGGNVATSQLFRGERAGLIGGIAYRTPIEGLTLKLELDANNYRQEGLNTLATSSPINIGVVYRYDDWLDIALGYERGNTLMAQLVFRGSLAKNGMPKFDSPPEKLKFRDLQAEWGAGKTRRLQNFDDSALALRLAEALEAKQYRVESVSVHGRRATVKAAQKTWRAQPRAIGRAARIMANELPPEVDELRYVSVENGLETASITLLRKDLEKAERGDGSAEEIAQNSRIEAPQEAEIGEKEMMRNRYPGFGWNWAPAMRHHIGGPDNPYFYQIFLRLDGELQMTRHFSVTGDLGFNLVNNFSELKLPSDSALPHVRSDIKQYLKQGTSGITRFQFDYLRQINADWYGRASGGLLEEMFGGVGGEILYRPFGKDWAIGAEAYRVRQRDYDMLFAFRGYRATTGHVDFYHRLPFYQTHATLSVGRYLAGDTGATLEVSRRFDSGATIGVFATKTNVSAQQFGEGSFDKGFYISIPIDMLSLYSGRGEIGMGWRPLTRDGGQRLNVGKRLYPLLRNSGPEALKRDWDQLMD